MKSVWALVVVVATALAGVLAFRAQALAQSGPVGPALGPNYFVISAPDAARRVELERPVREWLVAHGFAEPASRLASAPKTGDRPAVSPRELAVLGEVEQLLREGRELSARLDEHRALSRFNLAEERLRASLEIPHVHAWLAEVNLELGLCAAQLGELALAETALTRATSLDPARTLQAAEAPPAILSFARGVERRRANVGLSQVSIEAEPEGALLWLDGHRLGPVPHELSVSSGVHVLQVTAPGYRTYAVLLELGVGRRAAVRVRLDPLPEHAALLQVVAALGQPGRARAATEELAAATGAPLWFFEGGNGPFRRALAYRCDPECELEGALFESSLPPSEVPSDPREAQAWLSAKPAPASERLLADDAGSQRLKESPWWKRWPFWTATVVAVAGAAITASVLSTRGAEPAVDRELTLDPGQLPR